jgi:hypothetical protein
MANACKHERGARPSIDQDMVDAKTITMRKRKQKAYLTV